MYYTLLIAKNTAARVYLDESRIDLETTDGIVPIPEVDDSFLIPVNEDYEYSKEREFTFCLIIEDNLLFFEELGGSIRDITDDLDGPFND